MQDINRKPWLADALDNQPAGWPDGCNKRAFDQLDGGLADRNADPCLHPLAVLAAAVELPVRKLAQGDSFTAGVDNHLQRRFGGRDVIDLVADVARLEVDLLPYLSPGDGSSAAPHSVERQANGSGQSCGGRIQPLELCLKSFGIYTDAVVSSHAHRSGRRDQDSTKPSVRIRSSRR